MLKIFFGLNHNALRSIEAYFRNTYEPEWFEDDLVKQMVKDIDNSEVISGYCINSPILGQISPDLLSGGVKTLICMLKDEENPIFDIVLCGENCEEYIYKISQIKDLTVSSTTVELIFKGKEVNALCLNDGKFINNWKEFYERAVKYVRTTEC